MSSAMQGSYIQLGAVLPLLSGPLGCWGASMKSSLLHGSAKAPCQEGVAIWGGAPAILEPILVGIGMFTGG